MDSHKHLFNWKADYSLKQVRERFKTKRAQKGASLTQKHVTIPKLQRRGSSSTKSIVPPAMPTHPRHCTKECPLIARYLSDIRSDINTTTRLKKRSSRLENYSKTQLY
jgi:hypothetical protein